MRPSTACLACRNRRRKCELAGPEPPCAWCKERGLPCSLAEDVKLYHPKGQLSQPSLDSSLARSVGPHRDQTTTDAVQLPSAALCIELVELYFKYIHDLFHSLFHRPSVLEDVADGSMPEVLLFAIISLSARFSNDALFSDIDPRVRGRPYGAKAQSLLNLRDVSLTTVQACVLLGAFYVTEGEPATEAVYYSIASRNALLLDLPHNADRLSPLDQEINRRVWWSLCMIDVWSSNGLRLPRNLPPNNSDDVPYPIEETIFLRMRRRGRGRDDDDGHDDPRGSSPPSTLIGGRNCSSSLLTQMVKLNAILVQISLLNQSAAAAAAASPRFQHNIILNQQDTVDELSNALDKWYEDLPPELRDTQANLDHYAALGLGPMFVAVYLGYYHYGVLLFYQYLHADSHDDEHPSAYYRYALRCKEYAIGLCEILYRAYSTPGCDVYYTMVGHVLVIASTTQLHILLFDSDESQIRAARRRLEKNFSILTRLQAYWPSLDVCYGRFGDFHRACLKYKETSFQMDKWMLRFLFDFAKPIGERNPAGALAELVPWSTRDLGFGGNLQDASPESLF
ncbi:hypothetical protein PV08_07374 [Exophiala spinifera]|uniref:Zn(2)-C6 fungal-type domain-containing protein n=1 Tax=Exophiala spinifera TaxID=91928 RepID=A0A0D2B7E9_9EURO|nr:uncharacterized protein PV08_07374 [Exophiala spinifera]KIW14590.1 hypothetical protein PV08_07374 [Exophiala spinifera]